MNLSATKMFPLTLIGALAALSFWLDRLVRTEDIHPALRRHDPDYIAEGLVIRDYDASGIEVSTLAAEKMVHYPDDDSTDLVRPRILDKKPGRPPVSLTATRGTMNQNGDEIFLYDDVLLVRAASDGRPEARISTSFLHLVRSRSLVRSDREVSVKDGGRTLEGRGLEYDHDAGQLRLQANVRGRFEPASR